MSSTLFLSPTIETSFQQSLFEINSRKISNIFAPVTILLPTTQVILDYRMQMGNVFNVRFSQFYGLGREILDAAESQIHEISDTSVRRLVRVTLQEMLQDEEITTFSEVWDKPGFINVMIRWLREMKSQGITPEAYQDYALESGNERDRQLATFYQRYQSYLIQHELADADGVLWLTCEVLEQNKELFSGQGSLFVIGFDQFSPVQLELLRHLHSRFDHFAIYLSWDKKRAEDSLALTRLVRTKNQLVDKLSLEQHHLDEKTSAQTPTLTFLSKSLFETEISRKKPATQDDIKLIEAPSREKEVRIALNQIKRLLIEGVSPVDMMLLAPHPSSYLEIVRSVSEEYQTPITYDQYLAHNPAIISLLKLLSLTPDFPWRETLEVLRSPYIKQHWLTPEQINTLDRLSRERPVISGREQWQFALKPLKISIDEDLQEVEAELENSALRDSNIAQKLNEIETGLMTFFDLITPPETGTYREYTRWLQTKILGIWPEPENGDEEETSPEEEISLNILETCRNGQYSERDVLALSDFVGILRRMLRSSETIITEEQTIINWDQYFSELTSLTQRHLLPINEITKGVIFGPLEAGRARSIKYLLILGLSEGEFPAPPPADVFYTSAEREGHPLRLLQFVPADDATLWWQVISNCRVRLTLSRPYLDDNGTEWMPSPYWEEVIQRIDRLDTERIPISPKPEVENSSSVNELMIALATSGAKRVPSEVQQLWETAQFSQSVVSLRESELSPGIYEGFVMSGDLIKELDFQYGHDHVWSPSRLNSYGNCPYGYFAQNVLNLDPQLDPEEGMDPLQFGSLLHELLEEYYIRLADEGVALSTSTCDMALQILEEICDQTLFTAPVRYGFRPGALWRYEQQEIRRMLTSLINGECEENGPEPRFSPYLQEVKFGLGKGTYPTLYIHEGEFEIKVRGVIDRVDRDTNGNLRIIDYKSGRTGFSKTDIKKGLSLQTAIYALAVEQLILSNALVIDSFYLHIPNREKSGHLKFSGGVIQDETVQEAVKKANFAVDHIHKGEFPAIPAKPMGGSTACRSRCDFASLCRVTRQSIIKARRSGF